MSPEKAALRKHFLDIRHGVTPETASAAAEALLHALPELCAGARTIAAYAPMRGEVDVLPAMRELEREGYAICLPVITPNSKILSFRAWKVDAPLERAAMDTLQPDVSLPEVMPDLMLVPLLAFDEAGMRLGYGGGYYDATLRSLRAKNSNLRVIGVAYACQQTEILPRMPHDEMLNAVVTEKGAVRW